MTTDRGWRIRAGAVPIVFRPAAPLTALWVAITLFIAGPPTFRYSVAWCLGGGVAWIVFVVLHEMGHVVPRMASGSVILQVEVLGLGAVTSSTGRVTRREDVICTLSGLLVTGSLAALAAPFTLSNSVLLRDVATVVLLANGATLFENLLPASGNDSAVLLELANEKEAASAAEVRKRAASQARLMLVAVSVLALVTLWSTVGDPLLRYALTGLVLLYGAWAWSQWTSKDEASTATA